MKVKRVMMMRSEKFPQVKEIFPIINGIFAHCDYDFGVVEKAELDRLFYTNYGLRSVAPLVTSLVLNPQASEEDLTVLAHTFTALCSHKWDKLKDLYITDYDPLHNYLDELVETVEDNTSNNTTLNTSDSGSSNTTEQLDNTRTDNLKRAETNTSTESGTSRDEASLYGFNSTSPVPSNLNDGTDSTSYQGTTNVNNTGTQTNVTNKTLEGSNSRNLTSTKESDVQTRVTKTSTHRGNIGNLTTQQLIKQEIELRRWNFIEAVLEDAKELLTIPMYL